MKEITRNEAMEGTWKEMSVAQRLQLLKRLRTNEDRFNQRTDIEAAAKTSGWWKLPIPLRTFLQSHFADGRFTRATLKANLRSLGWRMKGMDKADREYENL